MLKFTVTFASFSAHYKFQKTGSHYILMYGYEHSPLSENEHQERPARIDEKFKFIGLFYIVRSSRADDVYTPSTSDFMRATTFATAIHKTLVR